MLRFYNLRLRSNTFLRCFFLLFALAILGGCDKKMEIVSDLEEREANEILVFLASKGIAGYKEASASSAPGAGQGSTKWSISVDQKVATNAMAILNQNGLPRIKGVNLLDLFAKQGLMSSQQEEMIRYQAGLAEQIASTIRKIDGVIDADVQISFPSTESSPGLLTAEGPTAKVTAAVYVKHQGILDDPNSHLVLKIKRLVSGSINGLELNDVTVISDKARFTDIVLNATCEPMTPAAESGDYVSIWSIAMNKNSTGKFRLLFTCLSLCAIVFAALAGWFIWKLYPSLKGKDGWKELLKPSPFFPPPPPSDNEKEKP